MTVTPVAIGLDDFQHENANQERHFILLIEPKSWTQKQRALNGHP